MINLRALVKKKESCRSSTEKAAKGDFNVHANDDRSGDYKIEPPSSRHGSRRGYGCSGQRRKEFAICVWGKEDDEPEKKEALLAFTLLGGIGSGFPGVQDAIFTRLRADGGYGIPQAYTSATN